MEWFYRHFNSSYCFKINGNNENTQMKSSHISFPMTLTGLSNTVKFPCYKKGTPTCDSFLCLFHTNEIRNHSHCNTWRKHTKRQRENGSQHRVQIKSKSPQQTCASLEQNSHLPFYAVHPNSRAQNQQTRMRDVMKG